MSLHTRHGHTFSYSICTGKNIIQCVRVQAKHVPLFSLVPSTCGSAGLCLNSCTYHPQVRRSQLMLVPAITPECA